MMKMVPQLFTIGALAVAVVSGALAEEGVGQTATQGSPNDRPVCVFIVAGQSNAQGYNHVREYKQGKAEFPKSLWRQPDVLFWQSGTSDEKRAGSWGVLRVADSGSFGPEISFAHDMAKALPDTQVAMIKCASGGTGIARSIDYNDYIPALMNFKDRGNNWHPPSEGREAGILYKRLIANVRDALSTLEREHREWDLTGIVWMQGEHEAGISQKMATDYGGLLTNFMGAVKKDLKTPSLPFAIGEVNGHTWAYGDIVRANQAKICGDDRNAVLVKTVDLSRSGSGGAAHFDADSMILLGSRFANGFQRLWAEQRTEQGGGAHQPATAPDSKSESTDKLESEVRPR